MSVIAGESVIPHFTVIRSDSVIVANFDNRGENLTIIGDNRSTT